MKRGNLTYDPWNWLKITFLSSTASALKDGKISLEVPLRNIFVQKHQNKVILAITL